MGNLMLAGPRNASFCDAAINCRPCPRDQNRMRFAAHGGQWDDARFPDRFPDCSKFPPSKLRIGATAPLVRCLLTVCSNSSFSDAIISALDSHSVKSSIVESNAGLNLKKGWLVGTSGGD